MSEQETSSPTNQDSQQFEASKDQLVMQFESKDYTLSPFKNKLARWIFDHYWLIFLFYLAILLFSTIFTVVSAGNINNILTRVQLELRYPEITYKWCVDFDDGSRYIRIYFPNNETHCKVLYYLSEPVAQAGWFTATESYVTWIVRDMVLFILPIFISIFLSIVLFNLFSKRASKYLIDLKVAGRLISPLNPDNANNDLETNGNWHSFVIDFVSSLRNRWGHILFLFWLSVAYILIFQSYEQSYISGSSNSIYKSLAIVEFYIIAPLILAFIMGYGIRTMYVTAVYIRKLTSYFDLDIQPEHGDRCGGLKRLGDLCLGMAMIIISPTIVVGLFVIVSIVYGAIPVWSIYFATGLTTTIIVASLVFFWPLLNIHQEMVKAKEAFQDEAIERIAPVKTHLRALVGSGKLYDEETKKLEAQLEMLNSLYPADLRFPSWPIATNTIIVFFTSQILPIVSVATTIIDFFGNLVP